MLHPQAMKEPQIRTEAIRLMSSVFVESPALSGEHIVHFGALVQSTKDSDTTTRKMLLTFFDKLARLGVPEQVCEDSNLTGDHGCMPAYPD